MSTTVVSRQAILLLFCLATLVLAQDGTLANFQTTSRTFADSTKACFSFELDVKGAGTILLQTSTIRPTSVKITLSSALQGTPVLSTSQAAGSFVEVLNYKLSEAQKVYGLVCHTAATNPAVTFPLDFFVTFSFYCDEKSFAVDATSMTCAACPPRSFRYDALTFANTREEQCSCEIGTYKMYNVTSNFTFNCVACPSGGACSGL